MILRMADPDDFWWGTASSSTQAEGAAPASTWKRWEDEGRVPRSGEGNGFATNYRDELGMLATHGLTHRRLTLEWARLEPEQGKPDGAAIEHYTNVLQAAQDAGISVWATIHDLSLPGWFAVDEHGFLDDRARTYLWPRHVDFMGETFGDLVHGWIPIHEPLAFAAGGWGDGSLPPGEVDPERFRKAYRASLLAGLEAWRLLRSGGRPIATAMNVSPVYAAVTSREPDEREAAEKNAGLLHDMFFTSWIRLLRDGILAVPGMPEVELDGAAGAYDIIGFTYDHATAVYADGSTGRYPTDARADPTGYAPWAEGLGVAIRRLADELPKRPLLIAGAGVATPAADPLQDERRVEVLRDSLSQIDRARADGIDLRGFLHRSAVDGYEGRHGFDVQYGLFDIDRRAKPSAEVLAERARA